MKAFLSKLDTRLILISRRVHLPLARIGFFIVFFWFGLLKVIDASPATELVQELFDATFLASIFTFETFNVLFGLFEMLIGLLFIFPKTQRAAIVLLLAHLVMTAMPLVLLPGAVWQRWYAPTLEGQYIIKNIILLGLAVSIAMQLRTSEEREVDEGERTVPPVL